MDKRIFFIMPFGKPDVEKIWREVYLPVSESLGFEGIRIDERDDGQIKIDQIIQYISTADLVVGDITYERPNCYFELGYARAIKNHYQVILCARNDHLNQSDYSPKLISYSPPFSVTISLFPKYSPPRVHFDLSGFDVMCWDEKKLDDFKFKFDRRIKERLSEIGAGKEIPVATKIQSTASIPKIPLDMEALAKDFRRKAEKP